MWIPLASWTLLCTAVVVATRLDDRLFQQNHEDKADLYDAEKSILPLDFADEISPGVATDKIERVVVVESYDLRLEPFFPFPGVPAADRQDFTFDGKVTITFNVTVNTEFVHLRARELNIESVLLRHEGSAEPIYLMQIDALTTEVRLQGIHRFVVDTTYELDVEYWGQMGKYNGIFYNSYEVDGETRYAIATQLQTSSARKVFPGFDDLWFKASFDLSVIHPRNAKVFANNQLIETNDYGEKSITTFAETPRMSTYLFAFAVGEFISETAKSKRGVEVRVDALPPSAHSIRYWAEICAKCVDAMEEMTGVQYSMSKLDNVNMMERGGAMENWGMIVYSNIFAKSPLWDEKETLHNGMLYACHEIAHQWFGNLVTADHWGLLFLHESFGNYFENRAIAHFAPDAELEEMDFIKAKGLDSAADATHPVVADQAYFDSVTYKSGAGILRMLSAVVGNDKFYAALKLYLEKHQFSTTDHFGLIEAFEEALGDEPLCGDLQIREFILDFLLQVHYPIVDVDHKDGDYQITARPFKPDSTSKWNIPIFVENPKDKSNQLIWLLKNGTLCGDEALDPTKLFLFHHHGSSFARIHYSESFWERIQNEVKFGDVNEQTLWAMLDDREDQEKREAGTTPLLLKLKRKIVESTGGQIHPFFIEMYFNLGEANQDKALVDKIVGRVNYKPTTEIEALLTKIIGDRGVRKAVGTSRSRAILRFRDMMKECKDFPTVKDCNTVPTEARAAVYCGAAQQTDRGAKAFLTKYKTEIAKIPEAKAELSRLDAAEQCKSTRPGK